MPRSETRIEDLLGARSRAELRALLGGPGVKLSLPEVQRLVSHADALEPAKQALRLGIVHTYTSDLLDPWLNLAAGQQGLALQTYHAPYGLILQEAQQKSGLVQHQPDVTLLLLTA